MPELSYLLSSIPTSATLAVNDRARALQAAGHDVIGLGGGDPDFDTPAHIVEAAIEALRQGKTHYPSPTRGTAELREAIAGKMARENNVHVDPEYDIVVTPGSKWAIFLALSAILNPGDEVLYLEPVWVSYPPMIRLAGGVPVAVALSSDNGYKLTQELLREKITPRTRALMVNTPGNPTGRVLARDEIEAITAISAEHNLFVIADEIYEYILFDDHKHYSIAAEPGMAARTLTANGLSKSFAMTGWRLGWLAGPTAIMKLATKMNGQTVTAAATFTMSAAAAALNGPRDEVYHMRETYRLRRDFMVSALNAIDGICCNSPEGTFYLLPKFTRTPVNSLQLAERLLDEAGIAATPGIAFGPSAEKHLRLSLATATGNLERAAERLAHYIPRLQRQE